MPELITVAGQTVIERKRIGKFAIYERKPKPKGASKFLVAHNDGDNQPYRDFSRYALAVLWIKAQSPREVPRVVIDIETKTVVSTVPLDCTFIDGPHRYTTSAIVDPDRIDELISGIEKPTTETV